MHGVKEAVVESGGLMSYGADRDALMRRVGYYLHQLIVLKTPIANLPIERGRPGLHARPQTFRELGLPAPFWIDEATLVP
jgi:hypothetical protein